MMGYQHYSVEDLLADESFQRYCSGTDDAAVRFWNAVFQEQPGMEPKFKEAVAWYQLLNGHQGDLQQQTSRLLKRIEENRPEVQEGPARVKPLYSRWWVAAAVLVFVVCGLWFMVGRDKAGPSSVALAPRVEQDIAPGGDKAILTLADGTKVVLDTADNGAITQQGNVTVIKLNGQLAYNKSSEVSPTGGDLEGAYNTITTPRGGQYQLVLSDGSKVWLNAASSLRFPTAFVGKERRVELTGEGYFEVAASPDPSGGGGKRPFIVTVNDMDVRVLGTHFNINSYADEPAVKTTLLEGRVMVKKGGKLVYLNPGQQALVQPGQEAIRVVPEVNLDEVMAWKNGYFSFHEAGIQAVMRQLARWYDVTVAYKGEVPERAFEGEMQRDLMLSQALKILEKNQVHFKVEGKKIMVMP